MTATPFCPQSVPCTNAAQASLLPDTGATTQFGNVINTREQPLTALIWPASASTRSSLGIGVALDLSVDLSCTSPRISPVLDRRSTQCLVVPVGERWTGALGRVVADAAVPGSSTHPRNSPATRRL